MESGGSVTEPGGSVTEHVGLTGYVPTHLTCWLCLPRARRLLYFKSEICKRNQSLFVSFLRISSALSSGLPVGNSSQVTG